MNKHLELSCTLRKKELLWLKYDRCIPLLVSVSWLTVHSIDNLFNSHAKWFSHRSIKNHTAHMNFTCLSFFFSNGSFLQLTLCNNCTKWFSGILTQEFRHRNFDNVQFPLEFRQNVQFNRKLDKIVDFPKLSKFFRNYDNINFCWWFYCPISDGIWTIYIIHWKKIAAHGTKKVSSSVRNS